MAAGSFVDGGRSDASATDGGAAGTGRVASGYVVTAINHGSASVFRVAGDQLVWLDADAHQVRAIVREDVPSSTHHSQLAAPVNTISVATVGDAAFVANTSGSVQRWQADSLQPVAMITGFTSELLSDGASLFANTTNGVYGVAVLPQSGAPLLVPGAQLAVASGGAVYWLDGKNLVRSQAGQRTVVTGFTGTRLSAVVEFEDAWLFIAAKTLYRTNSATQAPIALAQLDDDGPLVHSGGRVYWLNARAAFGASVVDVSTGAMQVVLSGTEPLLPTLAAWMDGVIIGGATTFYWLHPG